MAAKMAESGREPGKDVLDDTDLADDPIISAIQSLRLLIDDLQHNDDDDEGRDLTSAINTCLLYTSPSPRDLSTSRMPSSA